jgi:type I restriction enzyme S subunit
VIDTKVIRNKILDLAVRGKLTEQLPEDGSAEELYQQIQMEKQALIKDGKIKKGKPLPEIAEEVIPFEIPSEWKWARWGNLSYQIQYGYNAPAKEKGKIKMVRITDIQNNKVLWDTVPFCDIDEDNIEGYLLKPNNILFARTGGTVGKSFLVENVEEDAVFAGYLIRTSFSLKLNAKYLKFFMESYLYWKQLQNGTTATAQPNCNANSLSKMLVPLPPFAEQKRIVEKIEQAFSVLDTIDELMKKYADNMTVLKSKLIDLAIQGKMTEQLPEDGTAVELYQQIQTEKQTLIKAGKIKKEKPLPEISQDEIPFEIPDNWKWVKLQDITSLISKGTTPRGGNVAYAEKGIGFLRAENLLGYDRIDMSCLKYVAQEAQVTILKRSILETNDILISIAGTLGKTGLVREDDLPLNTNQAIAFVRLVNTEVEPRYIVFALNSTTIQKALLNKKVDMAIPNLSLNNISNIVIPLPPHTEQKRIVERLDKLLDVCDELK